MSGLPPRPTALKVFLLPAGFDAWAVGSWDGQIILWTDGKELLARSDAEVHFTDSSLDVSVPVGPGEACRGFYFDKEPGGWIFDGTDYGPLPLSPTQLGVSGVGGA